MLLADLNNLPAADATRELLRCCGSPRWARAMAAARPFADVARVDAMADTIFDTLTSADWLEAFAAHPRIGESAKGWSGEEQASARGAGEDVRERLAARQRDYEARFGYIFIICATGTSAAEMLAALERRLRNAPADELPIASEEQRKITHLRIQKLFTAE
jgi:OHCU decarboxylase